LNKNLNQKTKDSVIWDLSGAFVRQFALLFISILLARLLEPEEFGILGMSMVFISISQVFTDVGFTSGLIQQKDTKDIAYSSVFYINLLISVVLSGVILLTVPLIANFYEIPKVEIILYYLAIIPQLPL
jgi:O-antigen/teichoic acid export membrane protein